MGFVGGYCEVDGGWCLVDDKRMMRKEIFLWGLVGGWVECIERSSSGNVIYDRIFNRLGPFLLAEKKIKSY